MTPLFLLPYLYFGQMLTLGCHKDVHDMRHVTWVCRRCNLKLAVWLSGIVVNCKVVEIPVGVRAQACQARNATQNRIRNTSILILKIPPPERTRMLHRASVK